MPSRPFRVAPRAAEAPTEARPAPSTARRRGEPSGPFSRRAVCRIRAVLSRAAASAAVVAAVGCGPVMYTANIMPASHAVEEARFAGAADSAPYEYYLAAAYLEKAQVCAGRGDYQDAIRFAEVAEENARKARDLARRLMRETGR